MNCIRKSGATSSAARPLVTAGVIFGLICLPLILVTIQLFAKRTASAPTFGIQGPEIIIATFAQISGSRKLPCIFFSSCLLRELSRHSCWIKTRGSFLSRVTVLTFVISNFLSYRIPMQPRYLIFLTIVYFIAIALSYKLLFTLMNSPGVVYGFIAFMVVINAPMLAGYYSGYTKDDWRGFSGGLQQMTRPGDIVVVVPGYISQPLDYYYSNTTDQTIEFSANTATDLKAINAQKNNNTVFFVVTGDINAANPEGDAATWLETKHKNPGAEHRNLPPDVRLTYSCV